MGQYGRFSNCPLLPFLKIMFNNINGLRVGALGATLPLPNEGALPSYSPVKPGRGIGAVGALPKGRDI